MTLSIDAIVEKFNEEVDCEKEYTLKEMKEILTNVYKNNTVKTVKTKTVKTVKPNNSEEGEEAPKKRGRPAKVKLDKNGNVKEKRAPSAYNNYVSAYIKDNKDNGNTAKELMGIAAKEWKLLGDEEKAKYK